MKPIGYRDLHGPSAGAYVFRLEQKQIGGFALAGGAVAVILLLLGVMFGRSGGEETPASASAASAPAPEKPRRPVFTAVIPETPESEGLPPALATPPSERPSVATSAAPSRSPARTAARAASARPAAASAPRSVDRRSAPAQATPAAATPWKPPTSYGFVVASFVVPASRGDAAAAAARAKGEAQVAALRKRGLVRARLAEARTADRVTYRVLADVRRYYDRADAGERKTALLREHRFREVWILTL